jgi:hypothetical protein
MGELVSIACIVAFAIVIGVASGLLAATVVWLVRAKDISVVPISPVTTSSKTATPSISLSNKAHRSRRLSL